MSKGKASGRHRQQFIPTPRPAGVAQPKGPFLWEHLNAVYAEMANYTKITTSIAPLLSNRDACKRLADVQVVADRAAIVARDVNHFADQLMLIRNRHQDRTGPAADMDEAILQIEISEQYIAWEGSFTAVVMPNVEFIQAQFAAIPTNTH